MIDEIVIAQALNGQVRIHAARSTKMVEEARVAHHLMPTSLAALGRVMTVTSVLASDLKKGDEKITSIINGHGPSGTILVQAKGNGDVRGFIGDPNLYMVREDGHLDVGGAVGTDGNLTVIKDLGLKEPFTGIVDLQSGEIGDDFTYYYAISEQTPSIVGVGVLVSPDGTTKAAGGLIFQLMPGASEQAIQACEKIAGTMKPVSTLIDEGHAVDEIIHMYFPDAQILEHRDIRWRCDCSRERFHDALMTLSEEDLHEMIEDGKGAEIVCQYCNTKYQFETADLEEILEQKHGVLHR